jgi:phosphoribosylformylglycinamidine synthase
MRRLIACCGILPWPTRAFLITIGDRTVGGYTARDQFVGPWQMPVADVAVTTMGYDTLLGEAFALGERSPIALINPAASGRMAVGEAITNSGGGCGERNRRHSAFRQLDGCGRPSRRRCRLVRYRAGSGQGTVSRAGYQHPGWQGLDVDAHQLERRRRDKAVVSPLSLIITAFAPCSDACRTLTPQLRS